MLRRTGGLLLLVSSMVVCGSLWAESAKTITLKIYDGKTGHPIVPTGYQVYVNHESLMHGDWVKQHDDGSAEMTVPGNTSAVALHLAYDDSMEIYVNCDADRNAFGDVWYSVPQIMTKGLVSANSCGKAKANAKYKTTAAPGELILFVREKNWNNCGRATIANAQQSRGEHVGV
jgi:hypothetical protein